MIAIPRPEYPRPLFRRPTWANLNGEWAFAFDDDIGLDQGWSCPSVARLPAIGGPYTQRITVPFCHQAALSGIGDTAFHDVVWYARPFSPPPTPPGDRLLLHFGAVDYRATVWVNGARVAEHEGGHTPFSADISDALRPTGNGLVVRAEDPGRDPSIPRGKQTWRDRPGHIFYTRTTGIWQTVWLEPVPRRRIAEVRLTPDVDGAALEVEVAIAGFAPGLSLRMVAALGGIPVLDERVAATASCTTARLALTTAPGAPPLALWSPERPALYDLRLERREAGDGLLDAVDSYFGMRKIAVEGDQVCLNNRPYYQRLVLDQGYFPGGILTAPTDDDLRRDIELAKAMGFNGARKHQKVEAPRGLYWADRLGFLVWGEMANAYAYSLDYVRRILAEWSEVVRRDYNHPCVVAWVPMNESAGGRLTEAEPLRVDHLLTLYHLTRSLDRTRPVISNDGWEHTRSDLCTIHDYDGPEILARRYATRETSLAPAPPRRSPYHPGHDYRGEPILVSEFGGILFGQRVPGIDYRVAADGEELLRLYAAMVGALRQSDVIRGFCYTQLTDVEQEVNGLLTADRRPKVDLARIRRITAGEQVSPGAAG